MSTVSKVYFLLLQDNLWNCYSLNNFFFYFKKEVRNATEAYTALMRGSPYVPRTLQMQLKRINIYMYVENNFIDSLGLGRDSNPDPSALKQSKSTTTPSTSSKLKLQKKYLMHSRFSFFGHLFLFHQSAISGLKPKVKKCPKLPA